VFGQRGHQRIVIDPAAASDQAIGSYAKVGFRAVGVMRHPKYGRGAAAASLTGC
jgi:aminoglycoside 6'-N-acetyltransferase